MEIKQVHKKYIDKKSTVIRSSSMITRIYHSVTTFQGMKLDRAQKSPLFFTSLFPTLHFIREKLKIGVSS